MNLTRIESGKEVLGGLSLNYDFISGMQNVSSKLRNEKELLASLVCSFRHGAGN